MKLRWKSVVCTLSTVSVLAAAGSVTVPAFAQQAEEDQEKTTTLL